MHRNLLTGIHRDLCVAAEHKKTPAAGTCSLMLLVT